MHSPLNNFREICYNELIPLIRVRITSSVLTSRCDASCRCCHSSQVSDGMRKDRLKHCRSTTVVSLTTLSHRAIVKGWSKIITDLKRNILQEVGKGWFSRVAYRVKKLALWSYCTSIGGQERREVGGVFLRYARSICPCFCRSGCAFS